MQTRRSWGRGDWRWGRGEGLEGTKTVRQEREGGGEVGLPGYDSHSWLTATPTQNLQVKWEHKCRVTTDVLLCIQYTHFPYLVASHLHPCYTLVPFFMGHNARMSGRQKTDPEPLCITGSPLQWAYGLLTYGTSQFVGSSTSHLTTACGNSLSFLFLSSIVTVLTVVRESEVHTHTPLIVLSWPFPPLKLVKLDRDFSFFSLCQFPFIF